MDVILILCVWLAATLAALTGSAWLLCRIWKLRATVGKAVSAVAFIFGAAVLYAGIGTLAGLAYGVAALSGLGDPGQRARTLAEGISEAMNCSGFGVIVAGPTLAGLLFLMRGRWPPSPQQTAVSE